MPTFGRTLRWKFGHNILTPTPHSILAPLAGYPRFFYAVSFLIGGCGRRLCLLNWTAWLDLRIRKRTAIFG